MPFLRRFSRQLARRHGVGPDRGPITQGERADASRDEQVQKISFLVREYIDARKPGASKKSMNQAQIRVVAEWIRDDFLKEAKGDCGLIRAWLARAESLEGKARDALLEERIKGPITGQVKILMVA